MDHDNRAGDRRRQRQRSVLVKLTDNAGFTTAIIVAADAMILAEDVGDMIRKTIKPAKRPAAA